jgi:acetylornithine/succinyldiaminopimelate/putrescine aminotransferase
MMKEPLFRDLTPLALNVKEAEGACITTSDGKKYLDFSAGWCVGNAGWNQAKILEATRAFTGPIYVQPDYQYERWEELAEEIIQLLPGEEWTCFRATGGTEAVEIALKTARAYNKRQKFLAFKNAYHGQSYACLALVGRHEEQFGPYPETYLRLEIEDWEKTTAEAVALIKKGDICAFISEPLICNLGVIMPPASFFTAVQEACQETKTVFIIDEVATGFGRTGTWFGFEHYALTPDIITMAKGLSSGHAPIGATVVRSEIAEAMRFDFSNYSTFGWHPLAVETALATIRTLREEKIIEKAEGTYLVEQLKSFCTPEGAGLCIAFDSGNPQIREECFAEGLLIETKGARVLLYPPLTITREEIDQAVAILQKHTRM